MLCPHCSKEIAEGQAFCQYCGNRLERGAPAAGPEGRGKTPWEDRAARGFFRSLLQTLKESLFRPGEFFRQMPVTGGLTDPLLYALIIGMVGVTFSYLWQILLQGTMQQFMPAEMRAAAGFDVLHGIGLAFLAVMMPFLLIVITFIEAGILHVLLMLFRGAKTGYEATFRVVAYSNSASIFLALPFCGTPVAWVWSLVLAIIGLKEAHQTTGGKAAFAVLFPLILCCGLILAAVFLGIFAAAVGSLPRHQ